MWLVPVSLLMVKYGSWVIYTAFQLVDGSICTLLFIFNV